MDIPSLLQRSNDIPSSMFFSHVVAWLEGVTEAQRTGQLLDPSTAAYEHRDRDDWTFYSPEPHPYPSPAMSSSSSSYAEPEAWAAPRDRLLSPVASIPSPICHDSCRAPCCHPANWGYVSAPPPPPFAYAYSNPHHPHPPTYTYPAPHHPDPRLCSNSIFVLPPTQAQELQESSDKLQLKLQNIMRQNQMASSRHQWSAANPSLSSAYERSRRSAAAHVTERRRRSVQATPYHKLALPYLAS